MMYISFLVRGQSQKKQLQTMTSRRKVSRKLITRSREIAVSCLYSTMAPRALQFQLLGVGWKTWNVLTSLSKTQLHKFVDWTPFLTLIFWLFWGLSTRSWDQAPRSLTRCGGKTLKGAASFRLKLSSWIKLLELFSKLYSDTKTNDPAGFTNSSHIQDYNSKRPVRSLYHSRLISLLLTSGDFTGLSQRGLWTFLNPRFDLGFVPDFFVQRCKAWMVFQSVWYFQLTTTKVTDKECEETDVCITQLLNKKKTERLSSWKCKAARIPSRVSPQGRKALYVNLPYFQRSDTSSLGFLSRNFSR